MEMRFNYIRISILVEPFLHSRSQTLILLIISTSRETQKKYSR